MPIFLTRDGRHVCVTQPRGGFSQRVEYRLQIERRAADDLEHVGGGGLLLEGFAQLVEHPRVLDGDHGLGGVGFNAATCRSDSGPGANRTTLSVPMAVRPRIIGMTVSAR